MYRHCIFCSAELGTNEMLEDFPVGRSVAFDAWKGRLWAVCPKCARWNLAPIEERWEAVEAAEKRFRDSRLRVQSENIGLCKLPDGTRLIRVGEALPGELAAWRYGTQLIGRRRQYLLWTGAAVAGSAAMFGGLLAAGAIGLLGSMVNTGLSMYQTQYVPRRVIGAVPAEESGTGKPLRVQRWQLNGARVTLDDAGEPALYLPKGLPSQRYGYAIEVPLTLRGETARALLNRVMVLANAKGAGRKDLAAAVDILTSAPDAAEVVRRAARRNRPLGVASVSIPRVQMRWQSPTMGYRGFWQSRHAEPSPLPRAEALALEMALHEESERRAMDGELAVLEAAWREAEEIAHIADALPDDPLERLPRGGTA